MKKQWKRCFLLSGAMLFGFEFKSFFSPILAMEPVPFSELSWFQPLPSLEDLDSLSEEERNALYEWLLTTYDTYEALPQNQKVLYAKWFEDIEELLNWFSQQVLPLDQSQAIFRLYNVWTGEHLFSGNFDEIQMLLKTGFWKTEGVAWKAPSVSPWPVYRVMDPITLEHFYTCDENEYQTLQMRGFQGEGIGFYSATSDQTPLYRLFNPNALFGAHHYTADPHEHDVLLEQGWKDEGIAWYGLQSPGGQDMDSFQDMVEEKHFRF